MPDSEASNEVDALKSIFEEEVLAEKSSEGEWIVSKKVRPAELEGVSSATVKVTFRLPHEYPSTSACVRLENPRGISDDSFRQLVADVERIVKDSDNMPIMFEVIQYCSDFLVSHQHSDSLLCPICLSLLSEGKVISTQCDHFAHSSCYDKHVEHTKERLKQKLDITPSIERHLVPRELHCPVCRCVLDDSLNCEAVLPQKKRLSTTSSRQSANFDFDWTRWRTEQARLNELFEKQKQQGGIIDLDEERRKNLVTDETVVIIPPVVVSNVPMESQSSVPTEEQTKAKKHRHRYRKKKI